MDHGTLEFFLERSRFRRRLTLTVLGVSALALLPFVTLAVLPRAERERVRVFLDRTPVHFGFEGPEEIVERMNLDARADDLFRRHIPSALHTVIIPETRKGGGEAPTAAPDAERFTEVVRDLPTGEGASEADIMARAIRRAGSTPVFRSEQLVIETLVRPDYPLEVRERGIEGRVALMALIDTTGQVASVELVTGEPGGVLEALAETAIRQTRFRPYRPDGVVREVYAVFRYAFRLY